MNTDDYITPRADDTAQGLCRELNAFEVLCFEPVKGEKSKTRMVKPVATVRAGRVYLSIEDNDSALLFFVNAFNENRTLSMSWELHEWAERHGGWFRVVWDAKTRPIGMEFVGAEECKNGS